MDSIDLQSSISPLNSDGNGLINIDPSLQPQQIETDDANTSSTPPSSQKKRKLDSWIYEHGILD